MGGQNAGEDVRKNFVSSLMIFLQNEVKSFLKLYSKCVFESNETAGVEATNVLRGAQS